jgi:rare lipoprotein A
MRRLVIGCAMVGMIALSPKSEAMPPVYVGPMPLIRPVLAPTGEVGVASWYGIEFQGRHTASGELFDNNKLTAAHPNLPFGTTVCVTNLKNHESAVLKINDRGPGVGTRAIDVSWEAAKKLGFLEAGLAKVKIDVISAPFGCVRHLTTARSPRLN